LIGPDAQGDRVGRLKALYAENSSAAGDRDEGGGEQGGGTPSAGAARDGPGRGRRRGRLGRRVAGREGVVENCAEVLIYGGAEPIAGLGPAATVGEFMGRGGLDRTGMAHGAASKTVRGSGGRSPDPSAGRAGPASGASATRRFLSPIG
jgi:hypothetical protein